MTIEFVKIDDMCHAILDYIGSDEFNKAISPEDRNAFMAGMGMASVVVMARCDKYRAETNDMHETESNEQ